MNTATSVAATTESSPKSHHMAPMWEMRGYRQSTLVESNNQVEDEVGELAYQRSFSEAAKMGRVPNPAFFINSPSAREYITKRDRELFPQNRKPLGENRRRPNPNFVPFAKAAVRSSSLGAGVPAQASLQAQALSRSAAVSPSLPSTAHQSSLNSLHPRGQLQTRSPSAEVEEDVATPAKHDLTHPFADPRSYPGQTPPLVMEPQFGPIGPPRMLR